MTKQNMLASVSNYLSQFDSDFSEILEAMEKVDRIDFMIDPLKNQAYYDTAMPTEKGQTISQPSTVARMLQLLELKKGDKVLEIGAGSGWNAALISYLIGKKGSVLSLEIHKELADKAKVRVKNTKNIEIRTENFLDIKETFDKIIFTAGIITNQEKTIENFAQSHLNNNGILLCPHTAGPLIIIKKQNNKLKKSFTLDEYVFVPLVLG